MRKIIFILFLQVLVAVGLGYYFSDHFNGPNSSRRPPRASAKTLIPKSITHSQAIPVSLKTDYKVAVEVIPLPEFQPVLPNNKGMLTLRFGIKEARRKTLSNEVAIFANLNVANPSFPYKTSLNLNELIQNSPSPSLRAIVPLPGDTITVTASYCSQPIKSPKVGANCPHYGSNSGDSFHSRHMALLNENESLSFTIELETRFQYRSLKPDPLALSGSVTLNRKNLSHSYQAPILVVKKHPGFVLNHKNNNGFVDLAYTFDPARILAIKPLQFKGDIAQFEIKKEELLEPNFNGAVLLVLNDCVDYPDEALFCILREGMSSSANLTSPIPPELILKAKAQLAPQIYDTGLRLSN